MRVATTRDVHLQDFTEAASARRPIGEIDGVGASGGVDQEAGSASQAGLLLGSNPRPGGGPGAVEETHGSMTVEQEIELKHKSIKVCAAVVRWWWWALVFIRPCANDALRRLSGYRYR